MSFKIKTSDPFDAEVKRLSKKYRSLKLDLHELGKELMENPFQGVEIATNIRKVRLAISSKGRGKSGGARVITYNLLVSEHDGVIYLLLIYDKADASNVKINVIKEIIKGLGL